MFAFLVISRSWRDALLACLDFLESRTLCLGVKNLVNRFGVIVGGLLGFVLAEFDSIDDEGRSANSFSSIVLEGGDEGSVFILKDSIMPTVDGSRYVYWENMLPSPERRMSSRQIKNMRKARYGEKTWNAIKIKWWRWKTRQARRPIRRDRLTTSPELLSHRPSPSSPTARTPANRNIHIFIYLLSIERRMMELAGERINLNLHYDSQYGYLTC